MYYPNVKLPPVGYRRQGRRHLDPCTGGDAMSSNSTRKGRFGKANDRPKKPYPAFPLTPHPSGTWQNKICGKIHYFGRWARRVNGKVERVEGDSWKKALEAYKLDAEDLNAGRRPQVRGDG